MKIQIWTVLVSKRVNI